LTITAIDKVIINFIVCCSFYYTNNALAASTDNDYEQLNESTAVSNINDKQDIGVYVLSRIVDVSTNNPVTGAEVTSSTNKVFSNDNGEFLLKVEPNGYIQVKKENYMELSIKVSDLKGKIKLSLIPKYLPIFPTISGSINYRNLGFSEKLNDISASGRFNDSFSIEAAGRIFNNIHLGADYENISGILNRSKISEKASLGNNLISLKAGYIFNIFQDMLDISAGLKGYWNNIDISNPVVNEDVDRNPDFLDFGSQRIGAGLNLELGLRPIKYTPLVLQASASYYPLINVTQPQGGQIPAGLNQFDFGISARFDFYGAFVQAKYLNKNIFQGNYSSNLAGVSVGLGYGF